MKDWRGEERHGTPPCTPHPSENNATSPFLHSPPLSSTICCHLFSQIPFKQRRSMALRQCFATTWITLHRHIGSAYPSWPMSLGQLEESPGSGFLLLFHIICLAITASLPWTRGIITIFQFKESRDERTGSFWLEIVSAPCCEEGSDRTRYRSSPDTNYCLTLG